MTVYATIDFTTAIPVVIGIAGLAGVIFSALRFRRDDTTAIVTQQDTIFNELRTLNDELRTTVAQLRAENDRLTAQVQELKRELN